MAPLTERQILELAADRASRQEEIRRNINLFNIALGRDACTGHERRPNNYVAEDPISFFGIKDVV